VTDHVGNKGEFPELGVEAKKSSETKASAGGAIGSVTAPAKGARPQNQFASLQEEELKAKTEAEAPKERPKFNFKGLLSKQNEANAEANKDLSEFQKKIAEKVIIHEAKPPRKTEGETGATEESKKPQAPRDDHHKPRDPDHAHKKEEKEEDDGFEQVEEANRKRTERKAGRGGAPRGGRGGSKQSDEPRERKPVKSEEAPQPAPAKKETKVALPAGTTEFSGWGGSNLFL
jgi:hypothetical protein